MKRYFAVLMLLGLVAAFASAAGQSEAHAKSKAATNDAADKAAIAALWVNYSKYASEGNLDAFLQLHERDAYKMPQNRPMFQPWVIADSLRAAWKKSNQTTDLQMSIEPKETVILGDYAYSMGTYSQIFKSKAGGPQTVFNGKFLDVLHKDSTGTWRILRDCYNSSTPPAK